LHNDGSRAFGAISDIGLIASRIGVCGELAWGAEDNVDFTGVKANGCDQVLRSTMNCASGSL
jgi:hypothetical protein